MAISIFLADDHPVVRRGMRALLEAEPDFTIVGESGDGLETVRQVERLKPNVLVLDLMMPGLNGLEALPILRQRVPNTRVVVLSLYADEPFVLQALRNGATSYLLKGCHPAMIVRAVRDAVNGRRYLSPPLSERAIEAYLERAQSGPLDPHENLTPREREVLQLAAEGHTNAGIAARLHLSQRTVENHRANLMRKLGLHNQTELIRYALRRGIIPLEP
jgi:DNA-binding NarL/FixJ family response regulator